MKTVLVLSIKERHAQDILKGTKKVELRRIRPRLERGDIVLIYTPRPIMALVGGFAVNRVIAAQPKKLWKLVGDESGLTKTQFQQYYSGSSLGFGICIETVWRLGKPMSLVALRSSWIGFSPPQSFRYLRADEVLKAKSSSMNLLPNAQHV
ncbi:conserved protein of unknown function [Nitrospira defluvii]|jgi:predicted transcriptional regulator|uniref:ASCH domain-containing protein n=1 Tax=Nitrospira defluvii TaxID=330214 RepID=D8P7U0_9BACT|nr:conserved protein of unknown function [Nitrospira defluvii]